MALLHRMESLERHGPIEYRSEREVLMYIVLQPKRLLYTVLIKGLVVYMGSQGRMSH